MDDNFEKLGQLIDSLENLVWSLKLPVPAEMHITQLEQILPEKVEQFKEVYIKITGENPWEY